MLLSRGFVVILGFSSDMGKDLVKESVFVMRLIVQYCLSKLPDKDISKLSCSAKARYGVSAKSRVRDFLFISFMVRYRVTVGANWSFSFVSK